MTGIGEKLKDRREELGLTQYQLSSMTGVCQQTISAIELEVIAPSLKTLCKLLGALNMTLMVGSVREVG